MLQTRLYISLGGGYVIAFEPVKHLYDLALENISLNPTLKDKIRFYNKAVGGKRGKLNTNSDSIRDYATDSEDYYVDVITIEDILEEYDFQPDILKMDCEGCEFEIIANADLSMFNDIIFEHHSFITGKNYKDLVVILEKQGFEVNTLESNVSRKTFNEIGFIHAHKYK